MNENRLVCLYLPVVSSPGALHRTALIIETELVLESPLAEGAAIP